MIDFLLLSVLKSAFFLPQRVPPTNGGDPWEMVWACLSSTSSNHFGKIGCKRPYIEYGHVDTRSRFQCKSEFWVKAGFSTVWGKNAAPWNRTIFLLLLNEELFFLRLARVPAPHKCPPQVARFQCKSWLREKLRTRFTSTSSSLDVWLRCHQVLAAETDA